MLNVLNSGPTFDHHSYLYTQVAASGHEKILSLISVCNDTARLRQWIYNADKRRAADVRNAAYYQISAIAFNPGISAIDNAGHKVLAVYQTRLTTGRCYKVKMEKFKTLLQDAGGAALLGDLLGRERYNHMSQVMLEMGLVDLTIEAAIISFPNEFDRQMVERARSLLKSYGFKGRVPKFKM